MASLEQELGNVQRAAQLIAEAFRTENKLLVAGNGGSAADALHFAAEFEGKFRHDRRGFPAICLSANAALLTAWTNDYTFDTVYERQIQNQGRPGDVFVAISTGGGSLTGGYSRNIATAAAHARTGGLKTIGLAGKGGGSLRELADICMVIDSQTTARIQEAHGVLLHLIVEAFEDLILGDGAHVEEERWNR
jgi:D-sedoheptulose 7-phosphate isomerase